MSLCHHDSIMVTMDNFSKVAHFSLMRGSYNVALLTHVFMEDIFWLHRIHRLIILNIYLVFTSTQWTSLQYTLGA